MVTEVFSWAMQYKIEEDLGGLENWKCQGNLFQITEVRVDQPNWKMVTIFRGEILIPYSSWSRPLMKNVQTHTKR